MFGWSEIRHSKRNTVTRTFPKDNPSRVTHTHRSSHTYGLARASDLDGTQSWSTGQRTSPNLDVRFEVGLLIARPSDLDADVGHKVGLATARPSDLDVRPQVGLVTARPSGLDVRPKVGLVTARPRRGRDPRLVW